jgi:NADPH:quinone reductase-like Zn-dependent oxidoreductase
LVLGTSYRPTAEGIFGHSQWSNYRQEYQMKAAVVRNYERVPEYGDFEEPIARTGEILVAVKAAALSRLVQSQASGQHYSSDGRFPFVPGGDGVGVLPDGQRVYFAFPTPPFGSMAERTVVPASLCVSLPDDLDDVTAAAAANPGMSSCAALMERAKLMKGESVLINGATGVSGRLAIQIAKHLGARRVLATGRNDASVAGLEDLGADVLIPLDQSADSLTRVFRTEFKNDGVDVVLDYLWGPSAECLMAAAAGHGSRDAEPRIRFVQIGSLSGGTITLPAASLRSSGLELMGSGLGSVSSERLVNSVGEVLRAIIPKGFKISAQPVPLAQVAGAWGSKTADRIVFTM